MKRIVFVGNLNPALHNEDLNRINEHKDEINYEHLSSTLGLTSYLISMLNLQEQVKINMNTVMTCLTSGLLDEQLSVPEKNNIIFIGLPIASAKYDTVFLSDSAAILLDTLDYFNPTYKEAFLKNNIIRIKDVNDFLRHIGVDVQA